MIVFTFQNIRFDPSLATSAQTGRVSINTKLLCYGHQDVSILKRIVPFTALLFSATFRKKIERLARDILIDPIRVVQGDVGEVFSAIQYLIKMWQSKDICYYNPVSSVPKIHKCYTIS